MQILMPALQARHGQFLAQVEIESRAITHSKIRLRLYPGETADLKASIVAIRIILDVSS